MLDAAIADTDIVGTALAGLTATPKTLPPKLFYDAEGVRLFEAITRLPEYYPTRTERALLARIASELVALAAPGSALVEYGASDEGKASLLLDAAGERLTAYLAIDVAGDALRDMRRRLHLSRPQLRVHAMCADFLRPLILPEAVAGMPKLGFFPGSTIGNLEPAAARAFLEGARTTLGQGAWLIVGVDLRKSPEILVPAYDDSAGVTAAFNLNILRRLNREAAADFDPSAFAHLALWNEAEGRIEMHLESLCEQTAHIAGTPLHFDAGETIHTENSYKHSVDDFRYLATASGWAAEHVWCDRQNLFSVHALRAR
jgi:dimethylhistidine N-methyltransferase